MKSKNAVVSTRRVRFWSAARLLTRKSNPLHRSAGTLTALAALAGTAFLADRGQAATYIYTPTNNGTGPDNWSTSPNFSPAPPVSGTTTALTFVGSNTTQLASGLTSTSTNNLGDFVLNILSLQGTDPAAGGTAATININGAAGSFLDFQSNGAATPVVNLNALSSGAGLIYNVNSNATLTNNTTFQGNGTATFNFNGIVSGPGSLTMAATGALTLGGANTYSGGTVVSAGTLNLGSTTALGTGSLTMAGGLVAPTATATSTNIATTGTAINFTSGAYTFAVPAITANLNLTGATGGNIVKSATAGNPVINGNLNLGGASRTFALADTGGDAAPELTVNGVISNGTVVMDNTLNGTSTQEYGTLFFGNSNNTYAGGTTINVGRLEIFDSGSLGTGNVTVGSRGTLAFGGSGQATSGLVTLANNLTFNHTANGNYGQIALQANSGVAQLTGTVTLAANTEFNVGGTSLEVDASGVGNVLTGSGALTKSGGGILILPGAQAYTGGTTVTGGTLQLGDPGLGVNGSVTGTINQTGGTIAIISSAAQTFANTVTGTGRLTIDASTAPVTVTGNLALGVVNNSPAFLASAGSVILASGSTINAAGFSDIGLAAGDSATVTLQGSASLTVGSDFNVSDNASSNGILNIGTAAADTVALRAGTLYVGKAIGTTGIVNQIAGTVTLTGNETRIGGGTDSSSVNSVGVYNFSGGTINAGSFQVGAFGSGQYLQTGGTFTSSGYPDVGRFTGGYGVLDVSGGTFSQTDAGGHIMIVGEQGTGIMTLRGTGTATFAGGLVIGLNGGNGTFNLDAGGTVTTAYVAPVGTAGGTNTVAGSQSTFNFNGGTLKNSAAAPNFFAHLTTANVFGGGAIIDTSAGNATIAQSLVAPAGGGLNAVTVANGGTGYITPPIVQITGGTGTGATGIAAINAQGRVTGITITNPGTGYTPGQALTVNLIPAGSDGGGGITGTGATFTTTVATNVPGGLTKLGSNALTLGGTNTYTGTTTVSAGTLISGSAGAIPASTALVNNATVNFNAQYGQAKGSTTPGLTLSSLTAGANSQFNFGLTNTTADYLAVTGAASVASGAKLTLSVAAGATGLTPGNYNLFTDAAGGLANFTLGTTSLTVGGQAYSFTLTPSSTSDILTITAAQTAKLYYTGNTSANLSTNSNYSTDAAGATPSTITPSGITDLVFSANTATAANFNTTLGGLTTANSLEFTGTGTTAGTTPVTIGGGTLTINAGANTFAAGTGIVIDAGAAADTISANLSLPVSETFINNSASVFTISGAIGSTNTGTVLTLNDAGGGGFLLSGANTYTGSTVIAAGTTSLGSGTALGNVANTVSINAGTLNLNGQTVTQSSLTMAGGILADTASTPGSLVLSAAGTAGAAVNFTSGAYAATAYAKTGNVSLTGATNFIAKSVGAGNVITSGGFNLNGGATTIALADTGGDAAPELAITGVISGTGSLTLNNQATIPGVTLANTQDYATLYLSGNNTYSGGTNITHGRIVVAGSGALGTGPVTISQATAGGGTLQFGNNAYATNSSPLAVGVITGVTLANAVNLGGALNGNYGVGIFNDSGDNTMTGQVTLTNASQTIFTNAGSLTISGAIGQSAGVTGSLTKTGAATLALTGLNSYTGVTTSTGGTLSVSNLAVGGSNSSVGASSNAAGNLVLGGNTTLLYTGAAAGTTDRGFTVTSGGLVIDNASNLTFGGQVVQANGSNSSFTKNNAGTLSFTNVTGTNTFTGGGTGNGLGFVANGGITALGGTAATPLAQTNQINSQFIVGTINSANSPSAEVDINGGTTTITDYIGVGRGNGTNNAATTLTLNNNAVVTSPNFSVGYDNGVAGFTSSPTVNFNGTSRYTDGGAFTVGESVNGTGGVSTVNVNGSAAVVLTSTGAMPLIGLNGAAVFNQNGGTVTTSNSIRLAANGSSTGTYNLNGGMLTTASVQQGGGTGNFVFNGGTLQASASDNPAAANNPTTFIAGVTTTVGNGGAIIDTNGFNVTDASALARAGGSTGGLTKNGAGILTMSAASTYVGTTTINAGTLTISINGGLAAGNVSVAAGATLSLATGVTAAHNAAMGTTLTLASTTTSFVNLSGTGVQDTVASLIVNGVTEPFGTYGAVGSGATFTNIADFTGTGQLLVAAIPEPSTWAATVAGVGLLAYARRRQVRGWLRLARLS